jgi:tryptophan synthase alpha chain
VSARGARYAALFGRLAARGEGAFVPFAMLGDPDPARSLAAVRTLAAAGADALELGLPFSDPVADGPVIQAAAARALRAGARRADGWAIVRAVRGEHPALPIGLLVYGNLVCHRDPAAFYREAAAAGVDSVLVADVPVAEAGPLVEAARAAGVAPVFIAPPNADGRRLEAIARAGEGYTYVTAREGVTGADSGFRRDSSALIARLGALGAAPPVLGFGISTPEQVRAGLAMGAAGVISGSAVVSRIAVPASEPGALERLTAFIGAMKEATRRPLSSS